MKASYRLIGLIAIFSILCIQPADAQKRKKYRKTPKKELHVASYDSLFNAYEFQLLKNYITEDIAACEEMDSSTHVQDSLMSIVDKAIGMMQSVEKVTFIDSIIVSKQDFFKHYGMSNSCGRIAKTELLLPKIRTGSNESMAYLNDFGDLAYFPISKKGKMVMCKSQRIVDTWQTPTELSSVEPFGDNPNYPYLLNDGTTLYFAAEGDASLGGYDIFVTNYDADTDEYMRAENIGMPFNSPANDYLYAVDEGRGIGWFATDRNAEKGCVCIYTFKLSSPRKFYNPFVTENLAALARIHSIKDTQDSSSKDDMFGKASDNEKTQAGMRFPINDEIIYSSVSDFVSEEAKGLFAEWKTLTTKIDQLENSSRSLIKLLKNNDSDKLIRKEISEIESEISTCKIKMSELEIQIRNTENEILKK